MHPLEAYRRASWPLTLVVGKLHAAVGYARRRTQSREFRRALDAELARMERFLTIRDPAYPAREGRGTATAGPT